MKKSIFISTILLFLAITSYGQWVSDGEYNHLKDHVPIFPRAEVVQLTVEDRLNDSSLVAYSLVSDKERAQLEQWFKDLDQTTIEVRIQQIMLQTKISNIIQNYNIKAIDKGLLKRSPNHPNSYGIGNWYLKKYIKNGVDFGIRWHYQRDSIVPTRVVNPEVSYIGVAFTNKTVVKYEGKDAPNAKMLDTEVIKEFAIKKGKWVAIYIKGGKQHNILGKDIVWPTNQSGQIINGNWKDK